MNGRELYEHLKTAIKTFGLAFHEMDAIEVVVLSGEIHFKYEQRKLIVYLN